MNKFLRVAALVAAFSFQTVISIASAQGTGSAPGSWTYCAAENQVCAFTGTQEVRYGAGDAYAYRTLTGSTSCNNSVFGDPAYGQAKSCSVRPVTSSWTACATEGGSCSFSGTRDVRYGASGIYRLRTLTGGTACTNAVFGDPAPGTPKTCDYGPLVGASSLPNGQRNSDIGAPAISGSATHNAGTYTISAAGTDVWDTADQFHFVYQPMTGNAEIVARINSVSLAHSWSKAGVMFRESLTGPSRHATVFLSASKGYAFQRRPDTGALSLSTSGGSGRPPGWVRLVRRGDLFEAFRSADGATWTPIGSDTIPMAATLYVGLAVTSHNATAATTAVIDNVRITGSTTGNQPPAVSLTAPANGSSYVAPSTVTLTAAASDPEGRLTSVDFYVGSTLLARDTTAPYSVSWSATTAGTYALSAIAYDADGGTTTSSAASVTVTSPAPAPPPAPAAPRAVAFAASTNHATSVTSYRLNVYAGSANPSTAAPLATSDLGKPTPDSTGTITVDRASFFSALASGSYLATVTAIGPAGQAQSAAVTFTR